ncbi:cytochrome c biogenesis protein CcdA, partial [Pedobacter sp. JY14-1]|uniref:cytochrome c biogenesis protein CcdA n=1 Tax=Pedobacter sp. JY14-1 TaxID=3034151 RepID=UPI0023E1FE6E
MVKWLNASMKILVAGIFIVFAVEGAAVAQHVDTISEDLVFTDISGDSSSVADSAGSGSVSSGRDSVATASSANDSVSSAGRASKGPAAAVFSAGSERDKTLWETFIAGLFGGFLAFLMPCIFPMVPLTISYFTKRAGSRGKGIGQALIYGLSIIVIYVALGLLITVLFGSAGLNALSASGLFNILFFILLVVFAVSFFGAFELTLPSSFVNKIDSKADNSKGLGGIFFMAASLALVSFSCTGP